MLMENMLKLSVVKSHSARLPKYMTDQKLCRFWITRYKLSLKDLK